MARDAKNGVLYISLDCNFFDKDKMFRVEERFGEVGTARALRLMMHLYSTEGCWLEWGEGSAYYFAKKVIGNAGAADEIEELVTLLCEIGFFERIEGEDGDETGRVYLTSPEIITDWMKIQKCSKRKINFSKIPQCVYNAHIALFTQNTKKRITSEEKPKIPEEKPKIPGVMQQTKQNNIKQTNNQSRKIPEGIVPEETSIPSGENPGPPADAALREKVCRMVWFRGISSDLVDAAAVCVERGWIGLDGIRNMRRKARDSLERFEKGGRGKEHGWEVIRDCVSLVWREHGLEPPVYSRNNPEPPPGPPAPKERMAAV